MWLDRLKELKSKKNISYSTIAKITNIPERSIIRVFQGDTLNPTIDTVRRIANALDGSLDDIFAEGTVVVGGQTLKQLQEENAALCEKNNAMQEDNKALNVRVNELINENNTLREKIEHKDQLLALVEHFIKKGNL